MFHSKDEFNTNGQHVIERNGYVILDEDYRTRRFYRNVYENEDGENYVRYDGFIMSVEYCSGVWYNRPY